MSLDGNGRYFRFPRVKARGCWWPSAAAISPRSARSSWLLPRPEFRQPGASRNHGAVHAGDRGHRRSLLGTFETPITGGNVSLYNETLGRSHLAHACDGHRGPAEGSGRRALASAKRKPRGLLLGGLRHKSTRRAFDAHTVRKVILKKTMGCRPRSTWTTKSVGRPPSARSSIQDYTKSAYRSAPRRAGGSAGRVLQRRHRRGHHARHRAFAPSSRCSTKALPAFWFRRPHLRL